MSFIPENYQMATAGGGNYTKCLPGETRLRILSDAVIGYEYWNDDNKPVRCKDNPGSKPAGMRQQAPNGGEERVKEFWAFKVYDYATGSMGLWQVTQAQIKSAILSLYHDADYGHPKAYDLKINRTGSGLDTKYTVVPAPLKAVSVEVKEAFAATPIDLSALFENRSPFEAPAEAAAPAPKPAATKAAPKAAAPQPVAAGDIDDSDLPF